MIYEYTKWNNPELYNLLCLINGFIVQTPCRPKQECNTWTEDNCITRSTPAFKFGNKALQIGQWMIREMDNSHLSVSHSSGHVARIYRSDGTLYGNVNGFNGWSRLLGEPKATCRVILPK